MSGAVMQWIMLFRIIHVASMNGKDGTPCLAHPDTPDEGAERTSVL